LTRYNHQVVGIADQADAAINITASAGRDVSALFVLGSEEPFHAVERYIGHQRRQHASYNLAKLPFELGFRIERERLRPGYGTGFHGAPLVVWPASGDRPLENGGADVPARQEPTAVIDPGEP